MIKVRANDAATAHYVRSYIGADVTDVPALRSDY